MVGFAAAADKGMLPIRAWFPYDVTKHPNYEITYTYQILALSVDAFLNVSTDTLVSSLMAQVRCRFQLLGLSLRNLCQGIRINEPLLASDQVVIVKDRLRLCVEQHCATLEAAQKLQDYFSFPTFMQLSVSLLIICVTAYQMNAVIGKPMAFIGVAAYLLDMMLQVFLYCYQGSMLSEESIAIADAAYECPWYVMPVPLRRSLLIMMTRTRRVAKFTAEGLTTLSLSCFMGVIKTSYSMFSILQGME
ncbi:unnamed protein product [Chilo suppressalis]|uniref:Odorant receptor n=1 Tax=Chilo suppressalis TaxID=168631 RepID=A0ABN8AZT8_CHISP|nr:unnamed protein product [Chilo suppressalis]